MCLFKEKQATTTAARQFRWSEWQIVVPSLPSFFSDRNTWCSWLKRVCRGPICPRTAAPPVLTKGKSQSVCASGAMGRNLGPRALSQDFWEEEVCCFWLMDCRIIQTSVHQRRLPHFFFFQLSLSSWLINLRVMKVDFFSFGTAVCSSIFSNCPAGQQCESVPTLMSSV